MPKRRPKRPTILRLPKPTSNKLELDLFRLTDEEINKNHAAKKVWNLYSSYFDSLNSTKKIELNKIMSRILGRYWVMSRQGRADRSDYELTKLLIEYSKFERRYFRRE